MIELIHRVSDEDLDLLERFYEGKVKKQEEIDRAEALVECIKESMDAPSEY